MAYEAIQLEIRDGIATLALNRPERRNALDLEMRAEIAHALTHVRSTDSVTALVFTGAGGSFCAGGDTKRMASEGRPPSPEDRKRQLRWEHEIPRAEMEPHVQLAVMEAASRKISGKEVTPFLLGRVGQRSVGFVSQGNKFVPGRFAFVTDMLGAAPLGLLNDSVRGHTDGCADRG
mgnify:CR=1 FL=1